jgi:hypothetical protein
MRHSLFYAKLNLVEKQRQLEHFLSNVDEI